MIGMVVLFFVTLQSLGTMIIVMLKAWHAVRAFHDLAVIQVLEQDIYAGWWLSSNLSIYLSIYLYYKTTRRSGDGTKAFADWLRQTSKDKPWRCTLRTSNGGLAQARPHWRALDSACPSQG